MRGSAAFRFLSLFPADGANLLGVYFMKMGKITAFITAIVAIFATFSFLTPATLAHAEEDTPAETVYDIEYDSGAEFVRTYRSYKSNYVFDKLLGGDKPEEFEIDYAKYTYTFTYAPVPGPDDELTDEQKKSLSVTDDIKLTTEKVTENEQDKTVLKNNGGSSIVFYWIGNYAATITVKENDEVKHTVKADFKVINNGGLKNEVVAYDFDDGKIKAYAEQVAETVGSESLKYDEEFEYPELRELVSSANFDYSDLDASLYYSIPGNSSSFSKTSSNGFKVSAIGKFAFYVTFGTPYAKDEGLDLSEFTEKTYPEEVNGKKYDGIYYFEDDKDVTDPEQAKYLRKTVTLSVNGETFDNVNGVTVEYIYDENGKAVCPVFSFTFAKAAEIKLTTDARESDVPKAYVGLNYKKVDDRFTIVTAETRTSTNYRLYFSTEKLSGDQWTTLGYKEKLNDASKEFDVKNLDNNKGVYNVTDVELFAFSQSDRNFFVAAKGYYYVVCEVGTVSGSDTICTYAIDGTSKFETAKVERDWGKFFKNNLTSVIFLGIAVLSFIGLLLVIFIKPKDATTAAGGTEGTLPKSRD